MAASASHKPRQPLLARFREDCRGNFATMAAVLIVPLIVLAGGATDYARSSAAKTEVQQALDRAVMQVVNLPADQRQAKGVLAFRSVPLRLTQADDPVFSTNTADGSVSAVTLARVPTAFLAMAGIPRLMVKVEASAGLASNPSGRCMTLTWTDTYSIFENGVVNAPGCRLDFQSTRPGLAAQFVGSTAVTQDFCVRGTVSSTASSLTNLRSPCTPTDTPPAAPTVPTVGPCLTVDQDHQGGSVTLNPGTYCGGFTATDTNVTLNSGVYVIKGGSWVVTRGKFNSAPGGVTFYVTDSSGMTLTGQTELNLAPQTSGAQHNILFMDNPAWSPLLRSFLNIYTRPSVSSLSGVIYMPRRILNVDGAGSNVDRINVLVGNITVKNVTGWKIQPLSPTGGSATPGSGAPALLKS